MSVRILKGDCRQVLRTLPDESVHCCVTSPPYYGLRDYGVAGQIGLESSPDAYVEQLVAVFTEVKRALRDDGSLWLNLGDSYAGSGAADGLKAKDLIGIPWMVAFALRSAGWWLRQDNIWHKPNPMPESVTDRCTKAHEYMFMLVKSERYYYDAAAIAEAAKYPGDNRALRSDTRKAVDPFCADAGSRSRTGKPTSDTINKRSVWSVPSQPFPDAHFATFPPALIEPCIKAGCPAGGTVLDPCGGGGTTGMVADRLGRNAILIELNPEYADMAERRIQGDGGMFSELATQ